MGELLLGDEAVGLAAMDAGIRAAFSYPGTPATEIFEFIQRRAGDRATDRPERGQDGAGDSPALTEVGGDPGIVARWSTNEKVAYEEALGVSYVGLRSLVSMKHVGLNVAADPFMSSALTGANGGLVLAVADDPGMHSSQNEQDSRNYAALARIPVLEPANQQEAYDCTREAFTLSESIGLPVMVRLVTRLAHSRSRVVRSAPDGPRSLGHNRGDSRDWILLPVNARRRNRRLIELQSTLADWSQRVRFNQLALRGPKGIITSGIAHGYVREVLGDRHEYSILKIGAYPIPVPMVREILDHCEEVFIVEEGDAFIESRILGLMGLPGRRIHGKQSGWLPMDGEMTADLVRAALGGERRVESPTSDLPARPPALCQGCPHCDTFGSLMGVWDKAERPMLFGDIGCYTLGALPPYDAMHTCVDMGASISMGLGAAKVGAHPVVCTIGDSTFTHSGMTSLLAAAHEDANMTVILMDNAAVAMTGGQEGFAGGDDFIRLLKGLGVSESHIVRIDPIKKQEAENRSILRREIDHRGLSVVIASRPCIHTKRRTHGRQADTVPVGEAQPQPVEIQ